LNKKTGELECNTCHVIKDTGDSPAKIVLRAANVNSSFCKVCHNRQNFRQPQQQPEMQLENFDHLYEQTSPLPARLPPNWKEKTNHLENEVLDQAPATIIKAGGRFGLNQAGQKLLICETCHRPHGARSKRLLVMNTSKSQLCAACHPKQSAATRREASLKGTHPLNVIPLKNARAKIRKSLLLRGARLGPRGELGCLSCHKLHEADPQSRLLPQGINVSTLCPICHAKQASNLKGTKHDISPPELHLERFDRIVTDIGTSDGAGTGKHKARKQNLLRVGVGEKNINGQTVEKSGVCGACHLAHGGRGAKMWAKEIPPDAGDAVSSLCLSCHSAGGCAPAKKVGRHSHSVGVSIQGAEGNSHQLPLFDESGIPRPHALVTCAPCHDAHKWNPPRQATAAGNFLRVAATNSKLCFGCHKQMFQIYGTEHDPRRLIYKMYNTANQLPFDSKVALCRGCHRVHNAKAPMLWNREPGSAADDMAGLCFSCHDFQKVAYRKKLTGYSHPMGIGISSLGKNTRSPLPLFDENYKRDPRGRIFCNTCHDTHKRKPVQEQPQQTVPPDDEGNLFLRLAANDSSSTLCTSCHPDKQTIKGTKHDPLVSTPRKKTPGQTGRPLSLCGTCHAAHNNPEPAKLWNLKLGEGKDLISQMCNSCHSGPEQFSHPLNITLSSGMNPKALPLYNRKLKPEKRGKILCPTCHNTHQEKGSTKANLLKMPAGAELCGECHPAEALIDKTDHDLRITAPEEQNLQGKTAAEAGVCGACHLVHHAPNQPLLWARKFGPNTIKNRWPKRIGQPDSQTINLGVAVCTSCHIEGECAGNNVPQMALHPDGIFIPHKELLNIQESPNYPLLFYFYGEFDVKLLMPKSPEGALTRFPVVDYHGRTSPTGNIVCITCHNVHQWNAHLKTPGAGKNLKGSVNNSFLRKDIAADFCADCHSRQALFLFSYYHKPDRGGIINTVIFQYKKFVANFTSAPLGNDVFTELIFRPGGDLPAKCSKCHNPSTSLLEQNVFGIALKGTTTQISRRSRSFSDIEVKCSGFHTLLLEKYKSYQLNQALLPAEDKPEGVCFKCHDLESFAGLNPHQNQLKQNGRLNRELCLLCHHEVPNPTEKKSKLIAPIESYCIGCHIQQTTAHPAGKKHFGQKLPAEALQRWQTNQQQGRFMPLQKNCIICSTCHNTHQAGVLKNDRIGQVDIQAHKLRADTNVLCSVCHQLPESIAEQQADIIGE
jgi:predicted CXXCH cytochrome family protein